MGLLILFIAMIFGSWGIYTLMEKMGDDRKISYHIQEKIQDAMIIIWIVSIIGTFTCIILALLMNSSNAADHAGVLAEREGLVYQLENKTYDYDNIAFDDWFEHNIQSVILSSSKKELYDDVIAFNKTVASHKIVEKNFWVGLYYGNVYYDVEPIDLNLY